MGRGGKDVWLCRLLTNERGIIFPFAIILLFIVTGAALLYTNSYFAQLKMYNSLESIYVRATINILSTLYE